MAYVPKTKITTQKVDDYITTVSEKRRNEAYIIIDIMKNVSKEAPRMWGPSMIGFGKYHYISKSGIEADWFKIGFSPRKAKISFYLTLNADELQEDLTKFGKYTRGKGCIYVNKLEDINLDILKKMTENAFKNASDFDARTIGK